jgi:hypothetical protein
VTFALVGLAGCYGKIGDPLLESSPDLVRDVSGSTTIGVAGAAAIASGTTASGLPTAVASNGLADLGSPGAVSACPNPATAPARAPLRRLTRFEYNNSVRDLLGDATQPARSFPSEELGNGFGNDADAQSVSSLLAEQYSTVAEAIAARATETPEALARTTTC